MPEKVVIAGGGHAAGQAVVSLRSGGFDGDITVVGEEPWVPYQRPPLSKKYLAGEIDEERLFFKPPAFYQDKDVELRLSRRVDAVDTAGKQVQLAGGDILAYDKLLLTTGSNVRRLKVRGTDLPGVHYLRSIADVQAIRKRFRPGANMVVIGGGYIGLEVAAVAAQNDLRVTVVEMADRVMGRVVARPVSRYFHNLHASNGVDLLLGTGLAHFDGDHCIREVVLSDGRRLPADLVIVGVGILPNIQLASDAGIDCDNGIVTDEYCQTSAVDVYAAGDCTNHPNSLLNRRIRLESVHNALEQAKTAAASICGNPKPYAQIPWFWSDQYDVKLQIAGLSEGYNEVVVRGEPTENTFAVFYLDEAGKLLATDAINSPREFMLSRKLLAAGATFSAETLGDMTRPFKEIAHQVLAK